MINLFVVSLFYILAGLIVFGCLRSRLSGFARTLAIAFFFAQTLVLYLSETLAPSSHFEWWLWNHGQERNIPSTLAAVQLAMAGGVAMSNALSHSPRAPWWRRLYLLALGWLFWHMARDEYYEFSDFSPDLRLQYAVLGAAAVLITLLICWRSPRRERLWHFMLVSGLGLGAIGALVLDDRVSLCQWLPWVGDCVWNGLYEEALEFLGIWLALVAMLGQLTSPPKLIRRLLLLFPLLAFLSLMPPFILNHVAFRYLATPVEVAYSADVKLEAYQLKRRMDALEIQIFMSSSNWYAFAKLGYSVHIVDQVTGDSLAGIDQFETRRHDWRRSLYDPAVRYRQWLQVDASSIAANRALWVVLTLWRERDNDYVRQAVLSSELPLLDDTQLVLGELVFPLEAPTWPAAQPIAIFNTGYVIETVTLPQRAAAGQSLEIAFAWFADAEGVKDHTQFLHVGQTRSGDWLVYDRRPLGNRLPTQLWYVGMSDEATWKLTLPANLAPGRYEVYTGLYDAGDLERVPVTDGAGKPWLNDRVALGSILVER